MPPEGAIMAHLWEPLLSELENGKSYVFECLTVREFQGSTFLSSSFHSSASQCTLELPTITYCTPDAEWYGARVERENFKVLEGLSIYISCQLYKKRLNDVSLGATLKCHHASCGARQRSNEITREASVKLCVNFEGKELWLSAYTNHVTKLLQHSSANLQQSSWDEIEEQLMNIKTEVQQSNKTYHRSCATQPVANLWYLLVSEDEDHHTIDFYYYITKCYICTIIQLIWTFLLCYWEGDV